MVNFRSGISIGLIRALNVNRNTGAIIFKKTIQRAANLLGFQISKVESGKFFNFQSLIYFCIEKFGTITFIQVGGCDGVTFDPLYPVIRAKTGAFKGIILEPVREYYRELSRIYAGNDQIKVVRCAVHNTSSKAVLYKPDPDYLDRLPGYSKGVVSFSRSHLQKYGIPHERIQTEEVPCLKLEEIMQQYSMKDPDLLVIDTEGYDAEILLTFDFERSRPWIIRFEHGLKANMMSPEQLDRIFDLLHTYKYELILEDFDATAIHRDLLLHVTGQ